MKVLRQRKATHFANCPSQLDAGWSGSDDNESEVLFALKRIVRQLCFFKSLQDAAANLGGLLNGLEAWGVLLPLRVAKVAVHRAAG